MNKPMMSGEAAQILEGLVWMFGGMLALLFAGLWTRQNVDAALMAAALGCVCILFGVRFLLTRQTHAEP